MKNIIKIRLLVCGDVQRILKSAFSRFKDLNLGVHEINVNHTIYSKIKKITKNFEIIN